MAGCSYDSIFSCVMYPGRSKIRPPSTTASSTGMVGSLDGLWDARKDYCSFGYTAQWEIAESGDELTVTEQAGSKCCGCVPNCFRKTHNMTKISEGVWQGKLGFKKISLTVRGPNDLAHMTTDGAMTMTRA